MSSDTKLIANFKDIEFVKSATLSQGEFISGNDLGAVVQKCYDLKKERVDIAQREDGLWIAVASK